MSTRLRAGVEVLESEDSISSSEDGGDERGEEEALMLGDGCASIPILSRSSRVLVDEVKGEVNFGSRFGERNRLHRTSEQTPHTGI